MNSCGGHPAPRLSVDSNDAWLPGVGSALEERLSVLGWEEKPCLFPESLIARLGPGLLRTVEGGGDLLMQEALEDGGLGQSPGGTCLSVQAFPVPPSMSASAHCFRSGPVMHRKESQGQDT